MQIIKTKQKYFLQYTEVVNRKQSMFKFKSTSDLLLSLIPIFVIEITWKKFDFLIPRFPDSNLEILCVRVDNWCLQS